MPENSPRVEFLMKFLLLLKWQKRGLICRLLLAVIRYTVLLVRLIAYVMAYFMPSITCWTFILCFFCFDFSFFFSFSFFLFFLFPFCFCFFFLFFFFSFFFFLFSFSFCFFLFFVWFFVFSFVIFV